MVFFIQRSNSTTLSGNVGKRDNIRGSPSILSIFRNGSNTFINTGALMLDRTLKTLKKIAFNILINAGKLAGTSQRKWAQRAH